jgi:hypothetical protein
MIANKCDKTPRLISRAAGEEFAKANNLIYVETSATAPDIDFEGWVRQIVEKVPLTEDPALRPLSLADKSTGWFRGYC